MNGLLAISLVAAATSIVAALISAWQSRSASSQAASAKDQATSAKKQVELLKEQNEELKRAQLEQQVNQQRRSVVKLANSMYGILVAVNNIFISWRGQNIDDYNQSVDALESRKLQYVDAHLTVLATVPEHEEDDVSENAQTFLDKLNEFEQKLPKLAETIELSLQSKRRRRLDEEVSSNFDDLKSPANQVAGAVWFQCLTDRGARWGHQEKWAEWLDDDDDDE